MLTDIILAALPAAGLTYTYASDREREAAARSAVADVYRWLVQCDVRDWQALIDTVERGRAAIENDICPACYNGGAPHGRKCGPGWGFGRCCQHYELGAVPT